MILKVGMQHWVLEYVLPSCSNYDPGLTLSYFTARSNLVKLYEYQRSRSLIDLGPNPSDSTFLNFFSSITNKPIEAKFHMESPWDEGTKVCSNGPGHMTKMAIMPVYRKNH